MKKTFTFLLLGAVLLSGCSAASKPVPSTEQTQIQMQLGNPWKEHDSMESAEAASGLDFPLPNMIAETYKAESYRVMNGQLMEVVYRSGTDSVIVRMQLGEGQDISGVFGDADSTENMEMNGAKVTVKLIGDACVHLICVSNYSFSLYAPNGYQGETCSDFLSFICTQ